MLSDLECGSSSRLKLRNEGLSFFYGLPISEIIRNKLGTCTLCGKCIEICPQKAISIINNRYTINEKFCNNCLECVRYICPHIENLDINSSKLE